MKAQAWIISITNTVLAAVGEFELVHIMPDNPVLFNVPKAPPYCQQVFIWENKIIPLMNLAVRFNLQKELKTNSRFIAIFAYRTAKTGQVEYGALFLTAPPLRSEVSDIQGCSLPTDLSSWRYYVRSCFQEIRTKKEIPILNIERLFAYQESVAA